MATMDNIAGSGRFFLQLVAILQRDKGLVGFIPIPKHSFQGFRAFALVPFILIPYMEITGGGAKLLLRDPLAAQAFILRLNRLDFIRVRLLPGLLVISRFRGFQKIGSRMPHTVGFAVMVQPFCAVSSTPLLIRCDLPRDMACLGLWRHTV